MNRQKDTIDLEKTEEGSTESTLSTVEVYPDSISEMIRLAELRMDSLFAIIEALDRKITLFLGGSVAGGTALLTYGLNMLTKPSYPMVGACIGGLIHLGLVALKFALALAPKGVHAKGYSPARILDRGLISKPKAQLSLFMGEIYKNTIEINERAVQFKGSSLQRWLIVGIFAPVTMLACYAISYWICRQLHL